MSLLPPPIAPELLAPNGRVLSSAANGSLEACVYGLLASTMLYPLLKTKTFDVRQIMRSRSTMVRMRSRNFHSSRLPWSACAAETSTAAGVE